jgi:DNA-binding GntR family transcriptional regulator
MSEASSDGSAAQHYTAQESVLDRLRNLILSRVLRPGERLVQSELAEQFGVSRTPIREALHKLASDGLVTISPHKGASVADFSLSELEDIYSIRIPLEGYGAYLATQNITDQDLARLEVLLCKMKEVFQTGDRWRLLDVNRQFYMVLYAIMERPRLYELIMRHLDLADLYRRMAFTLDHMYMHTISEHEQLLETLRQRDPEAAEHLTRLHLERTADNLMNFLKATEQPSDMEGN